MAPTTVGVLYEYERREARIPHLNITDGSCSAGRRNPAVPYANLMSGFSYVETPTKICAVCII